MYFFFLFNIYKSEQHRIDPEPQHFVNKCRGVSFSIFIASSHSVTFLVPLETKFDLFFPLLRFVSSSEQTKR